MPLPEYHTPITLHPLPLASARGFSLSSKITMGWVVGGGWWRNDIVALSDTPSDTLSDTLSDPV